MGEYIVTQYSGERAYGGPEAWLVSDEGLAYKKGDFRARPRGPINNRFQLGGGEDFEQFAASARFPRFLESIDRVEVSMPRLPFGSYYPRIYWKTLGQCISCGTPPHDHRSRALLNTQITILRSRLNEIFRFVEPSNTLAASAYSHEIRNLLILSCTEVEAQFRLILQENDVSPEGRNFSTRDFVKLKDVLRLSSYKVVDVKYPDLAERIPFAGWDAGQPTQSLGWYDAYNATKHDRENSFSRATLHHAIDAVYACEILRLCQYDEESELFISRPEENESHVYVGANRGDDGCLPWVKVGFPC